MDLPKKAHWASASDGETIQGKPKSCSSSWQSEYIWNIEDQIRLKDSLETTRHFLPGL